MKVLHNLICTLFTGQTSKEGSFMRFSYEFKRKCVELYYHVNILTLPTVWNSKDFIQKFANGLEFQNHAVMLCFTT